LKPNMMDTQLFYVGHDKHFSQALSASADAEKLLCKCTTPERISDCPATKPRLVIIDAALPLAGDPEKLRPLKTDSTCLVLALESPESSDPAPAGGLAEIYDDHLAKTSAPPLLQKKLQLYLRTLNPHAHSSEAPASQDPIQADAPPEHHTLSKKYADLQEQLSQTSRNLKLQQTVIEKINHISQLSRQVNCLDLEKIASVCIAQIPSLISARFASLYTYHADKEILCLLRHNHPYSIAHLVDITKHPNSPMARAIQQKKLLLIEDFSQWSPQDSKALVRSFAPNYQSNSCIIAPLLSGDKIQGVLNLADNIDHPSFDRKSDLPPVRVLCDIIGSAMSNITLYEEAQERARTDSMTHLLNHRTFYDALNKEVNRARRYGNSLSLIMVDLDELKNINDKQGHLAGDAALMHVAEKVTQCIREIDIPARYGGDEFAIILPNTSLADAMTLAQRLLEAVAAEPIPFDNKTLRTSVSVGVAQYRPESTVEEFMNDTDSAMFEAKMSGKNRIHIACCPDPQKSV